MNNSLEDENNGDGFDFTPIFSDEDDLFSSQDLNIDYFNYEEDKIAKYDDIFNPFADDAVREDDVAAKVAKAKATSVLDNDQKKNDNVAKDAPVLDLAINENYADEEDYGFQEETVMFKPAKELPNQHNNGYEEMTQIFSGSSEEEIIGIKIGDLFEIEEDPAQNNNIELSGGNDNDGLSGVYYYANQLFNFLGY
ncbi:MAG: hypothetical protein HRU35_08260 [Rickettsiaceae bacterium]|nr:hypothetical protein [Rickettsiaceae bacterium]